MSKTSCGKGEGTMEKARFEELEMQVIVLDNEDIITTSGCTTGDAGFGDEVIPDDEQNGMG